MDIEIAKSQARNRASQTEGDPSAKSSLNERGVSRRTGKDGICLCGAEKVGGTMV